MKVSVIIPALNEAPSIASCVESARHAGAAEVIVVDGGSTDGTSEAARAAGAEVVPSDRGRALQLNRGADVSEGEILLFLHADNRIAPTAIKEIRECLADGSILAGAFRQTIEHAGLPYRCLEWGNAFRARWLGIPYGDQGIFLRRTTFESLGGFPSIPIMEDLALMRRLRRLGRPVLLRGPIFVSPRRWEKHGILRQTFRNWFLLISYSLGVSPQRLAKHYALHVPGVEPRV